MSLIHKSGVVDNAEALAMYNLAYKSAENEAKNSNKASFGADEIAKVLEGMLTPILMKQNLLDKQEYSKIHDAISEWNPAALNGKEMSEYAAVQQVLLGNLPVCKQQQQQLQELKTTVDKLKNHLQEKINRTDSTETTPKQNKLKCRHEAISQLHDQIKGKASLDENDIVYAKNALEQCLKNKPDWSERPFLQKLMDVLSFGLTALYRAFNSKETELEEKLDQSIRPR